MQLSSSLFISFGIFACSIRTDVAVASKTQGVGQKNKAEGHNLSACCVASSFAKKLSVSTSLNYVARILKLMKEQQQKVKNINENEREEEETVENEAEAETNERAEQY